MNQRSFDPKTHTRRNSRRLPCYDYRSSGAYFITICTEKRQRVLEIPSIHKALLEQWHHLPQRFPSVRLDAFVIMPDHVHGILWLDGSVRDAPTLGSVIGAFKAWVTIALRRDTTAGNLMSALDFSQVHEGTDILPTRTCTGVGAPPPAVIDD